MSTIFALTTIISRGLVFLCLPFFIRSLSIASFGIYDFYHLLTINIAVLVSNSAINSLNRFYNQEDSSRVLGNCLSMICIQTFILGVTALMFIAINPLLTITLVNSILFAWFSFILAYYRLTFTMKHYIAVFTAQTISYIIATFILLYYFNAGIYGLWFGFTISLLFTLPWLYLIGLQPLELNKALFYQQLRYCFPLLLFTLLYLSFFSIDRFIIKYFLDDNALGIYGLLWRFGSLFQLGAFALYDAWPAIIFPAYHEYGNEFIGSLVFYYFMTLATISLCGLTGIPLILQLLFPHYATDCIPLLPFFFAALFFAECSRLNQVGCLIAQKTKFIPFITIAVVLAQLGLLSLCGYWNLLSIAFVVCINCLLYGVYSLATMILSTRYHESLFQWRYLVGLISYCLVILANIVVTSLPIKLLFLIVWLIQCIFLLTKNEKADFINTIGSYRNKQPIENKH